MKRLCEVIGVARSSYYAWKDAAPGRAARAVEDLLLAERIRDLQDPRVGGDRAYGVPRITAELNDGKAAGERINHKRVARVMRNNNLAGIRLRRRVATTEAAQDALVFPDLLERDFSADEPNKRYVGDITYLPQADGSNRYLASVIDCHSRKLVGCAEADHMRRDLVMDALRAARQTRGSLDGAVFHSDHGSVYTSRDFRELCTRYGITQSMGKIGNSADNALAESFNATVKREVLGDAPTFDNANDTSRRIFRWATRYNTNRRHSYVGNVSPDNFEANNAILKKSNQPVSN